MSLANLPHCNLAMSSIIIYDGPTTTGRMKVTFNLGFIFYTEWMVTFTILEDQKEIYQCTAGWINYAHLGQWSIDSGWNPAAATWVPKDVLKLVEDWLRQLPDSLLPQIETWLQDQSKTFAVQQHVTRDAA